MSDNQDQLLKSNVWRTPVRNQEPGKSVVLDDFGGTVDCRGMDDTPNHGGDSNVRHDDSIALGLGEEDRVSYKPSTASVKPSDQQG